MTVPRQVVPGRDYFLSRRCSEGRFFLRPDPETNNAFIYCLVLAAQRAKVDVNFTAAMSNHHHTGIHDSEGSFPVFIEHFHGLLARCQNCYLGRFESFWSSEPTSVVELAEPHDILEKMVYAFTNPVAADLVETVEEWPGVSSFQATLTDTCLTATRPKYFFRDDGEMPETVTLPIVRPKGFEDLEQTEWAQLLTERVRAKEAEHRQRREQEKVAVLGRAKVLGQKAFDSPHSQTPHFNLNPRVAARNKWARIEALRRNRGFVERYRAALLDHIHGVANTIFPFGTYWMRKFGKVLCEVADGLVAAVPGQVPDPAPA